MCYFITIGLPEDKAEFFERHVQRGFHITPIANASVLRQMGQGLCTYLLMSGGCSCGLFREPPKETVADRDAHTRSAQDRFRRKYEKMGWSQAKIDRALAQRPKNRRPVEFIGLRGDVQRFLGELARNLEQLAVVAHWYDEDLQESRLACKQGPVVSPEALLEERLRIEVDEIVNVKSSGSPRQLATTSQY
jgi:hypothetical protein